MNNFDLASALEARKPHLESLGTSVSDPQSLKFKATCPFCKSTTTVIATYRNLDRWYNGTFAQKLWSEDTAELLMSGICKPCFDSL